MIKLSELQMKEVIMIETGKRLGHIGDLEIDPDYGRITAIIIFLREGKGSFFGKAEELIIHWEQIATIGNDVILVRDTHQSPYLTID